MLELLIVLGLLTIFGVFLCNYFDMWSHEGLHITGVLIWVLAGIFFASGILATLSGRYESAKFIDKYKILQITIEENRNKQLSELERLELNKKVAEYNEELAGYKYDNAGGFGDICVVDEVSELEYLK